MRRSFLLFIALLVAIPLSGAPRAVEVSVDVDAPVRAVWQAWTTREGIVSFFGSDARIDLRPGGAYEILFGNGVGCNGCMVMAVQPERLLAFTWNSPPHLAEVRPHFTHVVLRFEPLGEKHTRVTLHEDGWGDGGEWDKSFDYFSEAWPRVLKRLQQRFAVTNATGDDPTETVEGNL